MGRLRLLCRHACLGFAGTCLIAACTLNTQGESALPEDGFGGAPEGGAGKGGNAPKGGSGGGSGGVAGSGTGGVAGSGTGGVAGSGTGGVAGSGTGGVAGSGTGGVAGAGTGGVGGTGGVSGAGGTVCTPVAEICNGVDDDCDGTADNGNPGGDQACTTGEPGICAAGKTSCEAGKIECVPDHAAGSELCDALDNDCDGSSDEDNPEGDQPCSTALQGVCAEGITLCQDGKLSCIQMGQPSGEFCNGLDDDCDAALDEGCPGGVVTGDEVTLTPLRGGNSGAEWSDACPAGMVLIGISGTANGEIDQVQGRCGTLDFLVDQSSTPFQPFVTVGAPQQDLPLHGSTQGTSFALECPAHTVVTRIFGRASNQVNELGIGCSEATVTESGGLWAVEWNEVWYSGSVGGTGGGQLSDSCAAGMVVRTLAGRADTTINAIRIGCHPVSLTLL